MTYYRKGVQHMAGNHGTWITAAAATAVQQGPIAAVGGENDGIILTLKVTVGTTLLLRMRLLAVLDTGEILWATASADVTGVGTTHMLIAPNMLLADAPAAMDDTHHIPIPQLLKGEVTHGNANEATYTLDYMFV